MYPFMTNTTTTGGTMFRTDLEPKFKGTYDVVFDNVAALADEHVRFFAYRGIGNDGPAYFLIDCDADIVE